MAIRANGPALAIAQASFPMRPAVHAAIVTFAVFAVVVPLAVGFVYAARGKRGPVRRGGAVSGRRSADH